MQDPKNWNTDWIKAGGLLGFAILTARMSRTPLATIISAMPFLIKALRQAEKKQAQTSSGTMTREEAALILGVSDNAPEKDVQDAHRRLITKYHPDAGGSDYLAAKINQARDILLP